MEKMQSKGIETSERQSNIELLRILSMLAITVYHYVVYGGILEVGSYTINKLVSLFVYVGGRVGVNIFILIMGYFMINSRFKIKKLIKLLLQVFFYSVILAIISVYRLQSNFEVLSIKSYFTPVLKFVYWFASYYVITYIMSPFLNKIIKSIGKENCEKIIVLGCIILSVIPTVFESITFAASFLTWFVYMYIIGAYIREYKLEFKNLKTAKRISLSYPIIAFLSVIISIELNKIFNLDLDIGHYLSLYSLIGLVGSIGIFMYFKDMNIKNNKIINFFAKTSFAVYLLQDHVLYKGILWSLDCKTATVEQSPVYIFVGHMIVSVLGIYLIGSLIEFLRINLIEKPIFKIKIFDKYFEKIDNWMNIV